MREFRTYFKTPFGYIFMGLFLLISGFFFTFGNLLTSSSYYTRFLGDILFVYLFAVPLLTMRLLSEERRQLTDQLLLTSPVTVTGIVVGKFIAAVLVFLLTLMMTVPYAIVVAFFGDLAVWQTVGGYVGFVLLGSSFIALGVLVSAVSENQISAAFLTFFSLLFFWFLNSVRAVAPIDPVASTVFAASIVFAIAGFAYMNTKSFVTSAAGILIGGLAIVFLHILRPQFFDGLIPNVLGWFTLLDRFEGFTLGILRMTDIVFYLSFTFVFLFVAVQFVEKRRWV